MLADSHLFCVFVSHLVLMTGTLAVLSQTLHSLVDESYVLFIDVKSQQPQSSCGAATDAVQELKRLTHQIIVVLVILVAQKVLEMDGDKIHTNRLILLSQDLCCNMDPGSVIYIFHQTQCLAPQTVITCDQFGMKLPKCLCSLFIKLQISQKLTNVYGLSHLRSC